MNMVSYRVKQEVIKGLDGKERLITFFDNGNVDYNLLKDGKEHGRTFVIRKEAKKAPKWMDQETFERIQEERKAAGKPKEEQAKPKPGDKVEFKGEEYTITHVDKQRLFDPSESLRLQNERDVIWVYRTSENIKFL